MSYAAREIERTIDGATVRVPAGTAIREAARGVGIDARVLRHDPRDRPVGVCRMGVAWERVPARIEGAAE